LATRLSGLLLLLTGLRLSAAALLAALTGLLVLLSALTALLATLVLILTHSNSLLFVFAPYVSNASRAGMFRAAPSFVPPSGNCSKYTSIAPSRRNQTHGLHISTVTLRFSLGRAHGPTRPVRPRYVHAEVPFASLTITYASYFTSRFEFDALRRAIKRSGTRSIQCL
jgi:hypothetical protein